jgi:hypothetical protein
MQEVLSRRRSAVLSLVLLQLHLFSQYCCLGLDTKAKLPLLLGVLPGRDCSSPTSHFQLPFHNNQRHGDEAFS